MTILPGCGHALLAEAPVSVLADLNHKAVEGAGGRSVSGPGLAPAQGSVQGQGLVQGSVQGQGLVQLSLSFDVTPLSIPISPALVGTKQHHHHISLRTYVVVT